MISFIATCPAGNAVQLLLSPPVGATAWRVLRKRVADFTGFDDPAANLAYEGNDKYIIDRFALLNDQTYFYCAFYLVGSSWVSSSVSQIQPAATFLDISTDVVDVLRERLELGLKVLVDRGHIQAEYGHVPVLLGSPAYEDVSFPLMTLNVQNTAPDTRFVGDSLLTDIRLNDTTAYDAVGWLSRYQISLTAWALNSDVRAVFRKGMVAILQANLPIFESVGMSLIEVSASDVDDLQTYPVPMYQAVFNFSCVAPCVIEDPYLAIVEVPTLLVGN